MTWSQSYHISGLDLEFDVAPTALYRYNALLKICSGLTIEKWIPQQNDMVERVIRTIKEECVHQQRFESIQHTSRAIATRSLFIITNAASSAEGENFGLGMRLSGINVNRKC